MKHRLSVALLLVVVLPASCAKNRVLHSTSSAACSEISKLSDQFDELVATREPFGFQQRMVFADPEVPESVTKMVISGYRSYSTATRVVSEEGIPTSWSMLRNSQFLLGESASEDALPDVWESSANLTNEATPVTGFGVIDLLKPKCQTISFDGKSQTFLFEPPEETLGLKELKLKIGKGKQAQQIWQQLKQVTVCKDVTRKQGCEAIDFQS